MIKTWKKNIFITGALLSFFFLLGLSTARADTCDPNSLTVSNSTEGVNGVYIQGVDINGKPAYYDSRGYAIKYFSMPLFQYLIFDTGFNTWAKDSIPRDIPTGYYANLAGTEYTTLVASTTCPEPEPEPETLVGGFFFKTPPASSLGAGVGTISTDVMGSLLPYIFICGGLLIGFWFVEKILALIPKDNTREKADREIARSKRDIKEEKRIMATLD
jgi:hypothetical protein